MVMASQWHEVDCGRSGWLCAILMWNSTTVQPSHFHRFYTAYGGVFIVMAFLGAGFLKVLPLTGSIL